MSLRSIQDRTKHIDVESDLRGLGQHAKELPPQFELVIKTTGPSEEIMSITDKHDLNYCEENSVIRATAPSHIPLHEQAIWFFMAALEIYLLPSKKNICLHLLNPLADYLSSKSPKAQTYDKALRENSPHFSVDRSIFIFLERAGVTCRFEISDGLNELSHEQVMSLIDEIKCQSQSQQRIKHVS